MTGLDVQILLWMQEHLRCPVLTVLFKAVTALGDYGIFWIALGLVLFAVRRTRKVGFASLAALGIGAVITNLILKPLVERTRPYLAFPQIRELVEDHDPLSFPSGHATAAFAVAFVFMRLTPKKYAVPVLVLAILIAFSRMYLGVHYPSDVITGVLIGLLSGWISCLITSKVFDRKRNET